jgi:RNA polymerase sigma-70 factor (ECF subfamily)
VLQVIYLVFNEGYSAAAGAEVTRAELTGEAIRLGRLLTALRPEPEVIGLLSLMLLQESRHAARTSPTGELILLENQDRSLWNREQIAKGVALVEKALKSHRFGSYTLQAAIAAVHAEAESAAVTDWRQIVALYNRLVRIQPSPVVQLNRAVAIAMRDGPEVGLTISTRCWNMANWQIITWRIQPVQICTAGSAGQLRLGPLMRKLWR